MGSLLTLDTIRTENFRLLKKVTLKIPSGLVLVCGVNEDIPGADSNMTAKSTLLHALPWTLYGCDSNGITIAKTAIHVDESKCSVRCSFHDEENNKIVVTRTRHRKPPAGTPTVVLSVSVEKEQAKYSGPPEQVQHIVDSIFGKKDLFLAAHIFGCDERSVPFALQPDKEQKQLFDLLVSAEDLDNAKEKAVEQLANSREREQSLRETLASVNGQRKALAISMRDAAGIDEKRAHSLAQALEADVTCAKEAEQIHEQATKQYEAIVTKVKAAKEKEIEATTQEEIAKKESKELNGKIRRTVEAAEEVKNMQICPTCKTKVSEEIQKELLHPIEIKIQELQKKLAAIRPITQYEKERESARKEWRKLEQQRVRLEAQEREAYRTVSTYKAKVAEKRLAIESARKHDSKIQAKNKRRGVLLFMKEQHTVDEIRKEQTRQDYLKFWEKGFGPSGIRAYRLDKITPILNRIATSYSDTVFGDGTSVVYSTQKQLQSGEYRDRFSLTVVNQEGKAEEVLSSGQAMRRNLVHMFSIIRLAGNLQKRTVRFLAFDEAFRTLDQTGVARVMSILRRLQSEAETIMVIEHNAEMQAMFDTTLYITRKRNASTVEER